MSNVLVPSRVRREVIDLELEVITTPLLSNRNEDSILGRILESCP